MADDITKRAARTSALIAIPIALIVGVIVFVSLHGRVKANAEATKPAAGTSAAPTVPVVMPAPSLSAARAQMCLAFIAALPTSVRGLTERHVSGGAQQNAAFGDPAITAQCGAPTAVVTPTDEIYPMSNVCWHEQTVGSATVWTTLDRVVPIAITVPKSYDQPGQWVNEFSAAIVQAIPVIKTPYNC